MKTLFKSIGFLLVLGMLYLGSLKETGIGIYTLKQE